jgi:hypothetical protein
MAVLSSSSASRWAAWAGGGSWPALLARLSPLIRLPVQLILCGLLVIVAPPALRAQSREYQVKAAFLYNFAQFVVWPETAFTNANQPFQIGVLGENPFGNGLEETIHGESIHGRPVMVKLSHHTESLTNCQIVFINKAEAAHFDDVFSKLGSRPVLTVSEAPGFAQRGGAINFYRDGGKVRFEINPDAAEKNGLKLSSELLTLGKIIHPESPPK